METEKSSEQPSVWEMDASSAWSWIVSSIRNRCRKLLTRSSSSSGAKRSGSLPGTSKLNQHVVPSEWTQEMTAALKRRGPWRTIPQPGSSTTTGHQLLVWSEREKAFLRPNDDTINGEHLRLPWE